MQMQRETIIEADLTWFNERFEPNVQVAIGATGLIEQVGFLDVQPTLRLKGRALLPGMVNAHSHAFQRGLRGFGETFRAGQANPSRREVLEELISVLEVEEYRNLSRMAFEEMLHHGITTVGEFQCVHHVADDDYVFDTATLDAAAEVGIRLVMLCSYVGSGPAGAGHASVTRRLTSSSVETFCEHVDRLRKGLRGPMQKVGVGIYRLDSVSTDEVAALVAFAKQHDLPVHIIADAERPASDGGTSVEALIDQRLLGPDATLVHCTHTPAEALRRAIDAAALVCLCPVSAANLGDRLPDVPAMLSAGGRIALGTDANMRVSMNEMMRTLEHGQRMLLGHRGVFRDAQGRSANALWRCASMHGAASLGVKAGRIAPGHAADLFAVDTEGLSLLGATPESLMAAFVFGADRACITHTCVGGVWHAWEE